MDGGQVGLDVHDDDEFLSGWVKRDEGVIAFCVSCRVVHASLGCVCSAEVEVDDSYHWQLPHT